jgi:bacillithiol biosynthesis deacetylase BshB1
VSLDVLAIGTHPDDVEIACGGTLAVLAAQGRRVGILHLTCGEAGTRGTPEERRVEAERAAAALGVAELGFLKLGDGALRRGPEEEEQLIERLRHWQPKLVLGPTPVDRHPDHRRAHHLVADACFYAGLARRGEGRPHRPAAVFSYMQHDPFEPSFIVDVTGGWEAKQKALGAYESQLHQPNQASSGPATKVASPEYRQAIEGRARHYGLLVNASFGEPFLSRLPIAVADPMSLVPGGLS